MVRLAALAAAMAVPLALAHPGESKEVLQREMAQRNAQHAKASRALSACQDSPEAKALKARAIARRSAKAHDLRAKRGLTEPMGHQKRDLTNLEAYTKVNHNKTSSLDYTLETAEADLFGSNNTCALVPETTIGPYYVTGEFVRQDITEGQAGVPMHIDIQFVDMNTCAPVPNIAADVWHCNSTGVYSGIDTSEGEGGLNSTFLRGVQFSDEDGVSAFDSLFPGHYDSRITHFHLVANGGNYTVQPNGTYTGGTTLHVGQIYFEDALVEAVEATYPYNTNTIEFTTWDVDGWMLEEATDDYDPFVEYVQLGSDLSDGLLAWITVAIDLSSDHTANLTAAASYYATGGVAHEGSSKGLPPSNPNSS